MRLSRTPSLGIVALFAAVAIAAATADRRNTLGASSSALIDGTDQFTGSRVLAVVLTADDFAESEVPPSFEDFDRGVMFVCNTARPDFG